VHLRPGDPIRVIKTKWDRRLHATFTGVFLGRDDHGGWVGARAGTTCWRRTGAFVAPTDWVTLVPAQPWQAGFYDPAPDFQAYVDVTTEPVWSPHQVRAVDLDLDVIQRADGSVFVDDEDEFEAHRTAYGYPDPLIAQARETCEDVLNAVQARRPPFDGSHVIWLEALRNKASA
jgi:hypothetical protein